METISGFLESNPMLALFGVIALGYAIGQISIKGLSLGIGAVLFSGLAIGVISPASQPPALLGTLGLVLFLYGIGIQYGAQFFAGFTSAMGIKYNLLGMCTLIAAALLTIPLMMVMKTPVSQMAGLYAGSTTTASAMMAAVEAAHNMNPAIAYSVALPFGILGTILLMYFMQSIVKPGIDDFAQKQIRTMEVQIEASDVAGSTLAELALRLPVGVQILAVRTAGKNTLPTPEYRFAAMDAVLLGSEDDSALQAACELIGQHAPGRIVTDRSHLDYLRVFASKQHVIGTKLSALRFPDGVDAMIVQIRRGDTDLLPAPDLVLEFGDRIGLFSDRRHFESIQKFFGDSVRGTTEFSYVTLGIGIVLGVLASIIPIPIPGIGTMKLGIAGGVLLVALVLGKLGRTGPFAWTMPLSANVILRNFGVSLFLAQVGMSSGEKFFSTLQQTGPILIVLGAALLLPLVLIPLLVGHFVMRIPFDDLLGITSGLGGSAAIVSYASKAVPSDRVELSYAMIFPGAIILKIFIVQLLIALWKT